MLVGCGSGGTIDRERAVALFSAVPIETAPGLSGLAVDDSGAIWTVAERDEKAYRITLDGTRAVTQTLAITGVPDGDDLEAIAVLGGGKLAFGTEGRKDGVATVLLAEHRDGAVAVTGKIELPEARVGIELENNHGAEGVCGVGETIVVAIEGAGQQGGKRWAPVVRIERGEILRTYRVWLTTQTGKLSALDCRLDDDGAISVLAIERHFEVTKMLTFTLGPAEDITPAESLDLGPVLKGTLNLEGIVWTKDGGVVAVVDNQWKGITGPSELLVFKPGVVK